MNEPKGKEITTNSKKQIINLEIVPLLGYCVEDFDVDGIFNELYEYDTEMGGFKSTICKDDLEGLNAILERNDMKMNV